MSSADGPDLDAGAAWAASDVSTFPRASPGLVRVIAGVGFDTDAISPEQEAVAPEYIPSPRQWVRDQVLYERSGGVGGREINRVGARGGPVDSFDGRYHDVVRDQRIVYAYDMHLDETKISVSLATVELKPAPARG